MPTVGRGRSAKHFPYTKKGRKAARKYAKKRAKGSSRKLRLIG